MKSLRTIIIIACILIGAIVGLGFYTMNQRVNVTENTRIYIPSNADYQSLLDTLDAHQCLSSHTLFNTLAQFRGLPQHVKAGSYRLTPDMRITTLIQKLYSGNQDPIRITINKHRTPEQLCQYLDSRLELSADDLLELMRSDSACASSSGSTRYHPSVKLW